MALTIKADDETLPAVAQFFGMVPPQPPPDNSVMAPDASGDPAALPASPGNTPDYPPTPDSMAGDTGPTKLDALAQLLNQPGANQDAAAMPPADLAQSMVPRTPPRTAGFSDNHPTLAKLLSGGLDFVQNAAPGVGTRTFGEGFQTAVAQPGIRAERATKLLQEQANVAHTKAQTEELKSHGEETPITVNGVTYYVPKDKSTSAVAALINSGGRQAIASQNDETKKLLGLRKQGLKIDPSNPDGPPVKLSRTEMSESEQATLDLRQSQQDAAAARAELDRAKNDPNSMAYKAAMGRLRVAAKNAETAAGRLGLAKDTFNANYFGTGPTGEALPGAPLTENGTPVGIRTANATKPTNSTRSKAEQAQIVKAQGADLIQQIDAHPDIFGVVAGRWNEFNAGNFGNASPEVRDAYTSLKSFAALQPALHGSRGIGMQHEFEDAVGTMKQNPEGLKASINSLLRTASNFQKVGTIKTAPGGGGNHPAATHVYDPASGAIVPVQK